MSHARVSDLNDQLEAAGQARLAAWLQSLEGEAHNRLALQCASLDLPLVQRLVDTMVRAPREAEHHGVIGPAHVDRLLDHPDGRAEARAVGEQALRANRVAVVLLAGGQGTRLGFDAPKGMFPIGPVSTTTLFGIHAAGIEATRVRFGCDLPFLLMTSPTNDTDTVAFLEQHAMFGLDARTVRTFPQGMLPAVDSRTGDILLQAPDRIALSPDGHGGIFRAMDRAAILGDLKERGIDVIMTMQVDNPLMRPADPEFIGAHLMARAEMSTLVVAKTAPDERMGVMATVDGRVALVEYTDLSPDLEQARDGDGSLTYWAGSTGVHCIDRAFATRIATGQITLPFHRSLKKVPTTDDPRPAEPNAIKFEAFMFDALPLAAQTATVEVARDERFAPVKNADGVDSPATCRAAMVARASRWLVDAGVIVPDGAVVEIDPRFAQDAHDLVGRVPTDLEIRGPLYLT